MKNAVIGGLTLVVLAACTPVQQEVAASTPAGFTIRNVNSFNGDFVAATSLAQAECRKHGRDAARIPDDTPDGFVQFDCVD